MGPIRNGSVFWCFLGTKNTQKPNSWDIQQVDLVEEVDLSEIMAIMRSPEKLEEARYIDHVEITLIDGKYIICIDILYINIFN